MLTFTQALKVTLRCLRQIHIEEALPERFRVSQPVISRIITTVEKALMSVLNPAVPTISEALLNTSGIAPELRLYIGKHYRAGVQSLGGLRSQRGSDDHRPSARGTPGCLCIPVPQIGQVFKNQKNILVDRTLSRTRFVVPDEGITRRESH